MKYKIVQANINDLENILLLNKKLFEYEKQYTDTYDLKWTFSKIGKDYFTKRLTQNDAICLIAIVNKVAIGYLVAFNQNYPFRSINPITEIENMFVELEYRNLGIGNKLIIEAKKRAKKLGAKRIRVEAISANKHALQFYRKMGFIDFNTTLETVL